MQTSGHGNDGLLIVVPIGVSVILGVIMVGGPANAAELLNAIVRDVSYEVMTMVSACF